MITSLLIGNEAHGSVGEALAEAQQIALGARQQRLQPRTPLHERLLAEIAAIRFKQIEAIDGRRHMSPVEQRKKVGLAVLEISTEQGAALEPWRHRQRSRHL